ncbi:hypothetical protein KUCAC02_016901 [Chaenocephalus aceratus]|nr:hypothetical protein KUCAC02_016901 [Chaenocephalus aceratus]
MREHGGCSDSSSDLDEEFPVFDFLQSGRHPHPASQSSTDNTHSGNVGTYSGAADVMMISSDSDDDAPYVPLAQRLKQRQETVISASSSVTNGKDAQHYSPSKLGDLQLSRQNGLSESEQPLSFRQVRTVSPDEAAVFPQQGLPPADTKKNAAKQTLEIQSSRKEVLMKKQNREGHQSAKEGHRQEQERQRAERKALAEAAKALRPEECIKHMVVAVDPALLQLEGGGTLLAALQALGCNCAIEKQGIPRSPEDAECVREALVVMQVTVDDFITLTHSYIQRHGAGSGPTLSSWVQQHQTRHPAKTLSLVVLDLEKYFREGFTLFCPPTSFQAVVHLQLHNGVSVCFLSTWKDFSEHITMTTKAVAEAPFKQEREKTGFSFYLETYPSPQLLHKAYSQCQSERESVSLLSELLIRRGEGVTSTTRHVGPELSRRLFLLMTSCDPENTLDSTV